MFLPVNRILSNLFLIVFLLTSISLAQAENDELFSIVEPIYDEIPGFNITVMKNGEIQFSKGFGMIDLENQEPASDKSMFRVYSNSKLWTVTTAAILAEAGKLNIQAPIQTYLPEFPEKKFPINSYHLATHTSGIRHYEGNDEMRGEVECESLTNAVKIFSQDSLLFQPGSKQSYSSWGYVLLSYVIQNAAEQDFLAYMTENIFAKTGMENTVYCTSGMLDSQASEAYEQINDKFVNVTESTKPDCKFGAGGYLSTSTDMAMFVNKLAAGELIGQRFLQMILQPDKLGIFTYNGMSIGGRGYIYFDTVNNIIVSFAGNAQGSTVDFRSISEQISTLYK